MVYLGYSMVYILCKRGLTYSDTPLYGRKPPLVFHLWCDQQVVCMRVYTKIKNVHSQCFHTEKKVLNWNFCCS